MNFTQVIRFAGFCSLIVGLGSTGCRYPSETTASQAEPERSPATASAPMPLATAGDPTAVASSMIPSTSGEVVIPSQAEIARIVAGRTQRASSWGQDGGNLDFINIEPGETRVLLDTDGPGMVTRIYMTLVEPDVLDFRDAVLRMYWDHEETPSVEVPLGDFFCVSNATVRYFDSAMMAVNPGGDNARSNNGYVCYFPMPFARHARIELDNQSDRYLGGAYAGLWFQIDYERYEHPLPEDLGRFHAQWRRENPTVVAPYDEDDPQAGLHATGEGNYVMLEAEGEGHIAGLLLQIDNIEGGWYGEGDEMIFIDGDTWPPSLHGTGTEELFNGGPTPDVEFSGPYSGFLLVENAARQDFRGFNAMYRWFVKDPIRFRDRVRMTIEHGHANHGENDYTSVVYWYQKEPHAPFPELPGIEARRPRLPEAFWEAHKLVERLYHEFTPLRLRGIYGGEELPREFYRAIWWIGDDFNTGCKLMHEGDYSGAKQLFADALETWDEFQPMLEAARKRMEEQTTEDPQ